MSREEAMQSDKTYYQVYDGAFRTKVREDYPNAIRRINKLNKEVFEREVNALFGIIEDVHFEDSDYGKQIKITLDKNEDGKNPILSFGVESKDGRDALRKLPSVDFSQEVRIMPYRFTPKDSPDEKSGISFTQKDSEGKYTKKVNNFFYDAEGKKYLHDFPAIDWDASSESEQKIYKICRDEFLVNYVQENVLPKFARTPGNTTVAQDNQEEQEEEIDSSQIPF